MTVEYPDPKEVTRLHDEYWVCHVACNSPEPYEVIQQVMESLADDDPERVAHIAEYWKDAQDAPFLVLELRRFVLKRKLTAMGILR